ncbi:unnamed protein product [Meloidogyne enterolobii]|uniref:Uncharacterized protein n=1 Tax=Meloidogyne enterolobii TaxID=390850 RepID=A0ACB1AUG3_MELEN
MFLKILILLLIINNIIAEDSNSEDSSNENSNNKLSDEFSDSVDVREQNLQDPQFIKEDDTDALPPLNNEENNRINEYTTEKIKEDEEDQLNNEGSGIEDEFPAEDNYGNGLDINTTAKYANDEDDNDNNESDGQGCVYEVRFLNEKSPRSKYPDLKAF